MRLLFYVLLATACFTGCGASQKRWQPDPWFRSDEARTAKEAAPDLTARGDVELGLAAVASKRGDNQAASDYQTAARLWYSAAQLEAVREEVERETSLALDEAEAIAERSAALEEERLALDAKASHAEAAKLATEQSANALSLARESEGRRYRRKTKEREKLHRQATRVLLSRATVVILAGRAMGLPSDKVDAFLAKVDAARAVADVDAAMQSADELVREAEASLGELRKSKPGPTKEERAVLERNAKDHGFEVSRSKDEGVFVSKASPFDGDAVSSVWLERIKPLLSAHPHGAVVIGIHTRSAKSATKRQESLKAALGEDRVSIATFSGSDRITLRFVSYTH